MNILKSPVTYFDSYAHTEPTSYGTIEDFLLMVQDHSNYNSKIRDLRNTDPKAYDRTKKQLPGVCFGKFNKRNDRSCIDYNSCLAFDIDKIKDYDIAKDLFSQIQALDYVFSVFFSVSGLGLRVLVNTNATESTHKTYYSYILKLLSNDLGENDNYIIDGSTKNISRLWFYASVKEGEYYLNQDSKIISIDADKVERPKSQISSSEKNLTDNQRMNICAAIIESRNISGRNNKVMELTTLSSEHGTNNNTILSYCLGLADPNGDHPFTDEEINNTVKKNLKAQIKNDNQLLSYGNKILGAIRVDEIIATNQVVISKAKTKEKDEPKRVGNKFTILTDFVLHKYDVRRNLISKDIEISNKHYNSFNNFHIEDISCALYENGFTGFREMLTNMLGSQKYVKDFNPLKSYLKNIKPWTPDKPDWISKLSEFVDTDDNAWFKMQFRKMLVRSLACSLGYIPFNKQVFCLVGEDQNLGKSSFLRFLCPTELKKYWQENLMLKDKDSLKALAVNIFILLDEVDKIGYKDLGQIKSKISQEKVKMRLPFGKSDVFMDRIVNFMATTNQKELLVDDQNVRWLIFDVKSILHDNGGDKGYNKSIDIDNVWAQAYYLLKNGFDFKLSNDEIRLSEERNNKHFSKPSIEQEFIQRYFTPSEKDGAEAVFLTASEILNYIKGKSHNLTLYANNIGVAMTKLGFKKSAKRINGTPAKGYWVREIEDRENSIV